MIINVDINNITKQNIIDIVNQLKDNCYKSHYIDYNNIAIIEFKSGISNHKTVTISPQLQILHNSVVWSRIHEFDIFNNKELINFIELVNPSILRFLIGENIKYIKLEFINDIDWANIDSNSKNSEFIINSLIRANKFNILLFIAIVRLYYTLDIDDTNFLIKENNITNILTLLQIDSLNHELIKKAKNSTAEQTDNIFGNIIMKEHNNIFKKSIEMYIIKYINAYIQYKEKI